MRFLQFIAIAVPFLVPSILTADSLNVAFHAPVTVQYAVNDPMYISLTNADPSKMVDNNFSTFFTLTAAEAGTFFTFDLGGEYQLTSFVGRAYSASGFRLRGYLLEGSTDGTQWTTLARDTNQLLVIAVASFPSFSARYVRLTVTHTDPNLSLGTATLLSEIQLWATVTSPTVYGVSLSASSTTGIRYQDIQWSTMLMDSGSTVDISYRPSGSSGSGIPIATNVPNTGRFAWETALIVDGAYELTVSPSLTGTAGTSVVTVANFTNMGVFLFDEMTERIGYISRPWGFVQLFEDSVKLLWRFTPKIQRGYTFAVSYSLDSAKTWQPFTVIADSSVRSLAVPAPTIAASSARSFFRIGISAGGIEYASMRTQTPVILSGVPANVTRRWHNGGMSPNDNNYLGGMAAYDAGPQSTRLLTGNLSMYDAFGSAFGPWDSTSRMNVSIAAADIDHDGTMDIVTPSGILAEDGLSGISNPLPVNTARAGLMVTDMTGDGKEEILLTAQGSIQIRNDSLGLINQFLFQNLGYIGVQSAAGDLNGDGFKEIAYAMEGRLCVIDRNGVALPGFPKQFAENLVGWVLVADLDSTGALDILAASASHLYCLKADGSLRTGFPVSFLDRVEQTCPALADLDGDGHLDIVFLTSNPPSSPGSPTPTRVHAMDRTGRSLPGWPAAIDANIPAVIFTGTSADTTYPKVPVFYKGTFAAPLIASIDGDRSPEIVLSSNNGFLYVLNADGRLREGYPAFLGTFIQETGVLGDFDHDGSMNYLIRWKRFEQNIGGLMCLDFGPNSYNPDCVPWPMMMQNPRRTGIAPQPVTSVGDEHVSVLPGDFALFQNYPNPFNPATNIRYALPAESHVRIVVTDMLGREVREVMNGRQPAGEHIAAFRAETLSSGLYLCRLDAGGKVRTIKMLLLR